jgi:hypothetical protein
MPSKIRVLKVQTGRIVAVDFRKYVVTVLGKEWPSYLPQAVVEAGSVAVKQYGWYKSLRPRRDSRGRCYDVKDSTGDQLYKPDKARVRSDHHRALDRTWRVHLLKSGRMFMTGYRRGAKNRCGRDATGWKLFARSATRCANNGKNYLEILRIYYSPSLRIVKGGTSSAQTSSAQTSSAQTASADTQAVSSAQTSSAQTASSESQAVSSARAPSSSQSSRTSQSEAPERAPRTTKPSAATLTFTGVGG